MVAFKVLLGGELTTLIENGQFEGTLEDLREGFIHLSSADQLQRVVRKHYSDNTDVHIIAIDVEALAEQVRWEAASNGQLYPHLYGALRIGDVIDHSPLLRRSDGSIDLSSSLETIRL